GELVSCFLLRIEDNMESIGRAVNSALQLSKRGGGTAGAVPRQVIRFLNDEYNRALLRGVIASGNRNFGEAYGRAGDVIARKCGVPWLYRFELMGTQSDIENVRKGVTEFWQRQPQNA
ncbi:class Ib ribonucleoside-diphosphate reductase assembly flavoprotein NrdI, partial [Pseudomonas aeruginosa]|uniref:class Ib ribonucleoside-diphosphate reductase assembly flavoprotein NrdI n=1 Tax=Pseudomonas aeruginosa TaxID=287 RepID=UPI0031B68799